MSPWGYETINRWNPNAVDPNRSFKKDSDSEEAAAIMKLVSGIESPVLLHMDLHEPRLWVGASEAVRPDSPAEGELGPSGLGLVRPKPQNKQGSHAHR